MKNYFFPPPIRVRYIGVKKDTLSCTMERSIIYLIRVLEGYGHHPEPLISYFTFSFYFSSLTSNTTCSFDSYNYSKKICSQIPDLSP